MQKPRPLSLLLASVVAALSFADAAWAVGFGAASATITVGQPLDFAVPLRLGDGEVVGAECVAAEVSVDGVALPAGTLRTTLDGAAAGGPWLRVRSSQALSAPTVVVTVAAGCTARQTRRFVLFAQAPAGPAPRDAATVAAPARVAAGRDNGAGPLPQAGVAAVAQGGDVAAAKARRVETSRAAPATAGGAPRLRLDAGDAAGGPASPRTAAPVQMAVPDEALAIIEQANVAVREAIVAATAAGQRVVSMEREVAQLRGQAAQQQTMLAQLRAQEAAPSDVERRLLVPLVVALLALVALSVWLWWRLRALEQQRTRTWAERAARASASHIDAVPLLTGRAQRAGAHVAASAGLAPVHRPPPDSMQMPPSPLPPPPARPTAMAPLVAATPASHAAVPVPQAARPTPARPVTPAPAPRSSAPAAADRAAARDEPSTVRTVTQALAPADVAAARGVSVEELIDLEQQAEFFVVLGQDEAAIDLLMDHLRQSGGSSALPYLKLLEIYRRRDDREAYERTRTRFNQRFNAYAPDWDADLQAGRSLEDYPKIMGWLQHVWPRPIDTMAELEALVFRKDGGELFDLPAYREVLFLYSLARDAIDGESGAGDSVDLLLPIGTEQAPARPSPPRRAAVSAAAAAAAAAEAAANVAADSHGEGRPTAPVDFDLSQPPDSFDSLFGMPEEAPRRR